MPPRSCSESRTDASAQLFPARPLKILVGYSPGGPADALARIAAQILAEGLGKPVVVENRPGAGGTIATSAAAKATPDGYTLVVIATSDVINPLFNKQVRYNIERTSRLGLVASAPAGRALSGPINTELVEYGRAHPGTLNHVRPDTVSHRGAWSPKRRMSACTPRQGPRGKPTWPWPAQLRSIASSVHWQP
jgi:tripartite-type tricarboxylate transporter receptor subunit TctC